MDDHLQCLQPAYAITAHKLHSIQYRNIVLCMDSVIENVHTPALLYNIFTHCERSTLILASYNVVRKYSDICMDVAKCRSNKPSMIPEMLEQLGLTKKQAV